MIKMYSGICMLGASMDEPEQEASCDPFWVNEEN